MNWHEVFSEIITLIPLWYRPCIYSERCLELICIDPNTMELYSVDTNTSGRSHIDVMRKNCIPIQVEKYLCDHMAVLDGNLVVLHNPNFGFMPPIPNTNQPPLTPTGTDRQ